jgi:hypothetical protein
MSWTKLSKTRAKFSQNTQATKAFFRHDRDLGIIDMHIGDMTWAISGQYLDILSFLVILTMQIFN